VYGSVRKWQQEASVTTDVALDYRHPPSRTPAAYVVFSIELVDLETGESVQSFLIEGNSVGQKLVANVGSKPEDGIDSRPGTDEDAPEQPDLRDDTRYKELFEEAAKQAFRKAARKLSAAVPHSQ
jgi:hypothetical protein